MKNNAERQPNAKEIDLPRGTMAKVAERLQIPYTTAVQRWEYEKPEVVEAVYAVVQEITEKRDRTKKRLAQIQNAVLRPRHQVDRDREAESDNHIIHHIHDDYTPRNGKV